MHLIFWLNGWFGFLQSIQGNCLEHRDYLPLPLLQSFLRILVPCCLLLVQRTGYPCALRRRDLQWTYGISSRESVASPLELGHQIWQAGGYSSKLGYQFETTDLDICFHMFSCLVPQSYFLGAWGLMILSHKPCVTESNLQLLLQASECSWQLSVLCFHCLGPEPDSSKLWSWSWNRQIFGELWVALPPKQ